MKKIIVAFMIVLSFAFPSYAKEIPCGSHRITFYCNCEKCCGRWANGKTASGTVPTRYRTIAASANEFEFGTKIRIEGFEDIRIVEDRGVSSGRIDVFIPDHQECLRMGMLYRDCYIVTGDE